MEPLNKGEVYVQQSNWTEYVFISILIFSVISFSWPSASMGQIQSVPIDDPSEQKTDEEKRLIERARQRKYLGGSDEEPLKVQDQLPTITRRGASLLEQEPPEPEDDDSHD
jgi:hypothetical protein